jgi:hypothetical protein
MDRMGETGFGDHGIDAKKLWSSGQKTNIRAAFGRDRPIDLWIIQMIHNHLFLST